MDNKLLLLLALAPILLALLIVLIDRRRTRKTMDTIEQMRTIYPVIFLVMFMLLRNNKAMVKRFRQHVYVN